MTAAILFLAASGALPSDVIFPEQYIPLSFSHQLHLRKAKIECDFCHERAPESTSSSDFLIPTEETCSNCHDIDRKKPTKQAHPVARCEGCHPSWPGVLTSMAAGPPRVVVPKPHIKFNHKIHLQNKVKCTDCHGDMTKVELATRAQLPHMPLCLSCHQGGTKPPAKCSTCHLTTPAGTVETQYPEGKLIPSGVLRGDEHTPLFRKDHAGVARNDERYCLNCHRKDECISCHNGVTKPFDFHGNDYLSIHPVEARRDSLRCQSCHRLQTFCLGCHQRTGVTIDPPGGDTGRAIGMGQRNAFQAQTLRFHPSGWVTGAFANNPDHHGWQAERNIRACVSCHREESCLQCHSTFTDPTLKMTGINPHPPGWAGSSRCRSLADRNKRVCLKCHGVGAMAIDCR